MSSVKSSSSAGESTWRDLERHDGRTGEIVKRGYLKKLKTMRKKYFILRGESADVSARLEYYDSEKKWRSNHPPKRSILLKTCFNINKRLDTKQKHVIALYTKDDCFCVVLESEEELEDWLKSLLSLQQGEDVPEGEQPKPTYEHVWQVTVKEKGLGNSRNILGPHLLCLTDKTLSLVQCGSTEEPHTYEFPLNGIRRCGYSDCFFYMEVGRSSCTGAGDLWMQTEDTNIAQNMHDAILHAMSSSREEASNNNGSVGSTRPRTRSSPGSDATRSARRSTAVGKPPYYSAEKMAGGSSAVFCEHQPGMGGSTELMHSQAVYVGPSAPYQRMSSLSGCHSHPPSSSANGGITPSQRRHSVSGSTGVPGRERCDSLPPRARTTSEGQSRGVHLVPGHAHRPSSVYGRGISHSPPVGSSPVSPNSGACSTDSAGSSLSIDEGDGWGGEVDGSCATGRYCTGHSLTPDEPAILEENCDDYAWTQPVSGSAGYSSSRTVPSLSLPIQGSGSGSRKISPNLSSSGFKSGSPSQGSYMDVYSPCGSSPLDNPGYMTMSPGAGNETTPRAVTSGNYSRGSSLAEEPYVPMGRPPTDDGYVDMDGSHTHLHHGDMSPSSSCSVTSGTPSTDLRFSEYHLEKVSSYFTPSEDDDASSLERPIRAYSVGSRADTRKSNRPEATLLADESSRVRAFSVGSRLAGRLRPRHTPPPSRAPPASAHSGPKSSSAPLLSGSWSGTQGGRLQMSDLMELDFSGGRNRGLGLTKRGLPPHREGRRPRSPLAYVDMRPSPGSSPRDAISGSAVSPLFSAEVSPYVDMRPGVSAVVETGTTSGDASPYVDMKPGCPPDDLKPPDTVPAEADPYVEWRPPQSSAPSVVRPVEASTLSRTRVQSFPVTIRPSAVPTNRGEEHSPRAISVRKISKQEERSAIEEEGSVQPPSAKNADYVEMGLGGLSLESRQDREGYVEMTVGSRTSRPETADYVELGFPSQRNYVDMQFHPVSHQQQEDSPEVEGYLPMQPGAGPARRPEVAAGRSAPLDTPRPRDRDGYVEMSWRPPPPRSLLDDYRPARSATQQQRSAPIAITRSTPPKGLQLSPPTGSSPYSSLRRQRRAHRASTAAPPDVTTPGPAAVFPFSPSSPPGHKVPVDATGGAVRLLLALSPPSDSSGSGSGSGSSEQPTPVNADYANCSPPRRPFSEVVSLPPSETVPLPRIVRARGSWGPGEGAAKFDAAAQRPPVPPVTRSALPTDSGDGSRRELQEVGHRALRPTSDNSKELRKEDGIENESKSSKDSLKEAVSLHRDGEVGKNSNEVTNAGHSSHMPQPLQKVEELQKPVDKVVSPLQKPLMNTSVGSCGERDSPLVSTSSVCQNQKGSVVDRQSNSQSKEGDEALVSIREDTGESGLGSSRTSPQSQKRDGDPDGPACPRKNSSGLRQNGEQCRPRDVANGPSVDVGVNAKPLSRSASTSSSASVDQEVHYASLDLDEHPRDRILHPLSRDNTYAQIDFSRRVD